MRRCPVIPTAAWRCSTGRASWPSTSPTAPWWRTCAPSRLAPQGETTRTIEVSVIGDGAAEPDETVVVRLRAPVNTGLASEGGAATGTIADDDATGLRVVTGALGTSTRTTRGRTVTVAAGVPVGVAVVLPPRLDRDLAVRFATPGVPLVSARYGFGRTQDRRTGAALSIAPLPPAGVGLCLPVAAALHAEAGGRALRGLSRGGAVDWDRRVSCGAPRSRWRSKASAGRAAANAPGTG